MILNIIYSIAPLNEYHALSRDVMHCHTNPYSELTQGYYISCSIITYDSAA